MAISNSANAILFGWGLANWFDLATGKHRQLEEKPIGEVGYDSNRLQIVNAEKVRFLASYGKLQAWDHKLERTPTPELPQDDQQLNFARLSPDGTYLACNIGANNQSKLVIWSMPDCRRVAELPLFNSSHHPSAIHWLKNSEDLFFYSRDPQSNKRYFSQYSTEKLKIVRQLDIDEIFRKSKLSAGEVYPNFADISPSGRHGVIQCRPDIFGRYPNLLIVDLESEQAKL